MHRSSAEYEAFSSVTASHKARVIAQALHVMKRKTEVGKKIDGSRQAEVEDEKGGQREKNRMGLRKIMKRKIRIRGQMGF